MGRVFKNSERERVEKTEAFRPFFSLSLWKHTKNASSFIFEFGEREKGSIPTISSLSLRYLKTLKLIFVLLLLNQKGTFSLIIEAFQPNPPSTSSSSNSTRKSNSVILSLEETGHLFPASINLHSILFFN